MNEQGLAFDESIPIDLFQGAEVEALTIGSIWLTLHLNEERSIILDYQGSTDDRDAWLCKLPLCGDESLMSLVGQTIRIEFDSEDRAVIGFSGGGRVDLIRDTPGADLVRFLLGKEEYPA